MDIETFTWEKETHDLLDYDSKSLVKSKLIADSSGVIHRKNNDCIYYPYRTTQEICELSCPILSIVKKEDSFSIYVGSQALSSEMWYILKYAPGVNGYELKEDDILKLGRVLIQVKKISSGEYLKKDLVVESLACSDLSENEVACKICCCTESDTVNPLISPCKCIGSMKYIHLECLRKWLQSKITSRSSGSVTSYFWSDFICELCKSELPSSIKHKGINFELITINYPHTPYMILEDIRPDENNHQILHLVNLQPGEFANIGRGHDTDIRLSDISVSRNHAKIRYYKGKFFVQDSKSKFGTLLKINYGIDLKFNENIAIQINRTMVRLSAKKEFSCATMFCCNSDKSVLPLNRIPTIAHDSSYFHNE